MHLIFRADASPRIGSGHIMRCLALAQAWQDGGSPEHRRPEHRAVRFAMAGESRSLEARLSAEDMTVERLTAAPGSAEDADRTASLARDLGAEWVVVDGYHFGADYQQRLKAAGLRVLLIDDEGDSGHYSADLVLNQNISAREDLYADREPCTGLLLGTRHALLQRHFLAYRDWQRTIPDRAAHLLVTLGGADADNVTLKVLRALGELAASELVVTVVVGGGNPHAQALRRQIADFPIPVTLRFDVSDMPDLMASADMAIAAGGITAWELAFMGLPSLSVVLAENQKANVEGLARAGVTEDLGEHETLSTSAIVERLSGLLASPQGRRAMSERGRELVDGHGARRVVEQLDGPVLSLREAQSADCRMVWEWFNDPVVRASSFSSDPIAWEEHLAWFDACLRDPAGVFYIVLDAEGQAVGQIRFKIEDGGEAVAAVSLAGSSRGKGLGSRAIALATERVLARDDLREVYAYIKPENSASVLAFERAGYELKGRTTIKGQPALQYARRKYGEVSP